MSKNSLSIFQHAPGHRCASCGLLPDAEILLAAADELLADCADRVAGPIADQETRLESIRILAQHYVAVRTATLENCYRTLSQLDEFDTEVLN
jgi:hypothetical protein